MKVLKNTPADRFWFSDVRITGSLLRQNGFNENMLQTGADLREKIINAFKTLFDRGYREVLIVGNDTLIETADIETAFGTRENVIGRSKDGGFYLLKLNRDSDPSLVLNKERWNGGSLDTGDGRFQLLDDKNDIDSFSDFLRFFPDRELISRIMALLENKKSYENYTSPFIRALPTQFNFNRPPPLHPAF